MNLTPVQVKIPGKSPRQMSHLSIMAAEVMGGLTACRKLPFHLAFLCLAGCTPFPHTAVMPGFLLSITSFLKCLILKFSQGLLKGYIS